MSLQFDILLVEDNPGDVALMTKRLEERGLACCIEVCRDGEDASTYFTEVKANRRKKPQLLILDINLPRKNGLEVLAYIKNDPDLHTIPAVIFSSSSTASDIKRAYLEGANGYIVKPLDLDAYHDKIDAIFEFWLQTARLPERRD